MKTKRYFTYILTNKTHTVLYTGITGNLKHRVYQHKQKQIDGFTKKYNVDKLVYFEAFNDPGSAIKREKQIKKGPRKRKEELINRTNKDWVDLYGQI